MKKILEFIDRKKLLFLLVLVGVEMLYRIMYYSLMGKISIATIRIIFLPKDIIFDLIIVLLAYCFLFKPFKKLVKNNIIAIILAVFLGLIAIFYTYNMFDQIIVCITYGYRFDILYIFKNIWYATLNTIQLLSGYSVIYTIINFSSFFSVIGTLTGFIPAAEFILLLIFNNKLVVNEKVPTPKAYATNVGFMFCNKCGEKISGDSRFCIKCGNKIG